MYRLIAGGASVLRLADGAVVPMDSANQDCAEYLQWVADGGMAEPVPVPTHAELVDIAKDEIRAQRQPILSVLDGLQASYITRADMPTAQVIEVAKQALRDLTKIDLSACTSLAEMKVAVLARYAQIASASPALKSAFAQAVQ